MAGKPVPIELRFWQKVNKQDPVLCWNWNASKNGAGYGQLWESMPSRIRHDAHRYSWILHFGPIPAELQVLHKCDNKLCVNPAHLYLGTRHDNMADALNRGQKPVGSQCSFAKLTPDQVKKIRSLKTTGFTQHRLSNMFNVSPTTIWRAYSGKAYKDVK